MLDLECFEYDALNLSSDFIRLVNIDGFDEAGRVKCSLKHARWSTTRYYALSYMWGKGGEEHEINLNGKAFKVRSNLHDFLLEVAKSLDASQEDDHFKANAPFPMVAETPAELRKQKSKCCHLWGDRGADVCWRCLSKTCVCLDQSGLLHMNTFYPQDSRCKGRNGQLNDAILRTAGFWVDAICLDQSNLRERNHQVQRMHEIYKSANKVFAWLGKGDLELLRYLSQARHVKRKSRTGNALFYGFTIHDHVIKKLASLEHWSRAWIVQETIMAQELMLMCSNFILPYSLLTKDKQHGMSVTHPYDLSYITIYEWLRHENLEPKIEFLFEKSRALLCSDVRDRIYCHRSLLKEGLGLSIHYEESAFQLALRTSVYFGGSFVMLNEVLRCLEIPGRTAIEPKFSSVISSETSLEKHLSAHSRIPEVVLLASAWPGRLIQSLSASKFEGEGRKLQQDPALAKVAWERMNYEEVWRCPICGAMLEDLRSSFCIPYGAKTLNLFAEFVMLCYMIDSKSVHFILVPADSKCTWIGPIFPTEQARTDLRRTLDQVKQSVRTSLIEGWDGGGLRNCQGPITIFPSFDFIRTLDAEILERVERLYAMRELLAGIGSQFA